MTADLCWYPTGPCALPAGHAGPCQLEISQSLPGCQLGVAREMLDTAQRAIELGKRQERLAERAIAILGYRPVLELRLGPIMFIWGVRRGR